MNRSTKDCLVQLMKRPGNKRKDWEIEALLPVLTWKIPCLRRLEKGIIMELLRLGSYKKYRKDRIITKEGKPDDKFYIIIQGAVTKYCDTLGTSESQSSLEDGARTSLTVKLPSITDKDGITKKVRFQKFVESTPMDTTQFGTRVDSLGSLQSFGELPVSQTLVKHLQLLRMKTPRSLRYLLPASKTESSGRARLSAFPDKHRKQYPDLYVKHDFREECGLPPIRVPTCHKESRLMATNTYIKRSCGYAVAERMMYDRNIEMCFVEAGEICCDVEMLLGLQTNIFTVTVSVPCDIYTLSIKHYEKLILKKSPQTLNLVKLLAERKLLCRKETVPGRKMDILPALLYRMKFVRIAHSDSYHDCVDENDDHVDVQPVHKPVHPDGATKDRSRHPDDIIMDRYKRNKAPLLKPLTQGADYYKEIMEQRAKTREDLRKKYPKETALCKSIRAKVKEAVLASVREGIKTENMIRKIKLGCSQNRHGHYRWN